MKKFAFISLIFMNLGVFSMDTDSNLERNEVYKILKYTAKKPISDDMDKKERDQNKKSFVEKKQIVEFLKRTAVPNTKKEKKIISMDNEKDLVKISK
jgi:hypothetical protein